MVSLGTAGTSCPLEIICETTSGNAFQLIASAQTEKDITKNPPIGGECRTASRQMGGGRLMVGRSPLDYVGTLSISVRAEPGRTTGQAGVS